MKFNDFVIQFNRNVYRREPTSNSFHLINHRMFSHKSKPDKTIAFEIFSSNSNL